MGSITSFLTFNRGAEEAVKLYTGLIKGSRINSLVKAPDGSYTIIDFELDGQKFTAMEAGRGFQFASGYSIKYQCSSQDELDRVWAALCAEGGEEQPCGWLRDRFGLSWQIIPLQLEKLSADPDPGKSGRVIQRMLTMKKIIIADLEAAHRGE